MAIPGIGFNPLQQQQRAGLGQPSAFQLPQVQKRPQVQLPTATTPLGNINGNQIAQNAGASRIVPKENMQDNLNAGLPGGRLNFSA
jgi:hypothetical protein